MRLLAAILYLLAVTASAQPPGFLMFPNSSGGGAAAPPPSPVPDILWITTTNNARGTNFLDDAVAANGGYVRSSGQFLTGGGITNNGTSDYGRTSNSVTYGTKNIMVTYWLYRPNAATTTVELESGSASNNGWNTSGNTANGKDRFSIIGSTGGNTAVEITNALPTAQWVFITAYLDASVSGGNIVIWTNKVVALTASVAALYGTPANFGNLVLNLGARNGSSLFLQGALDDVRIYSGSSHTNATDLAQIYSDRR